MDDIQANSQTKKGGTVVPPSDFQSDTTKCADNKAFQESSSRPRAREIEILKSEEITYKLSTI